MGIDRRRAMRLFPAPTIQQFFSAAAKDLNRPETRPFVFGFFSAMAVFLPVTLGATDDDKQNSAMYKGIYRHEFRKGGKYAPTWPEPKPKSAAVDDDDDDLIPE